MGVIYEPKGRAREYAELAVNLYEGCVHGCLYCYGPRIKRTTREAFHGTQEPRQDILDRLHKSATYRRDHGQGGHVLLCFTSDPYQPDLNQAGAHRQIASRDPTTRTAIEILHRTGHTVNILTKGGPRSLWDFDLLTAADEYGATLTFVDLEQSFKWEPRAAAPGARIACLKAAHTAGIRTWVSLEPIIDLQATLDLIDLTHNFVDRYMVGKLNYHPLAAQIDWHKVACEVSDHMEKVGATYNLKADLAGLVNVRAAPKVRR